ncbi:MAG: hypothetical protein J6C38_00770 [Oscillospiraceae bacterium]|nr:hypothetical protein [Oscillospiraceae bacterium]
MKALKIGGFFLAGAIIQTVFYYAEYLGIFAGYGGLLAVASFTSVIGVVLGNKARDIAQKKMKMSPFVLTMCYVAGTLAVIAALFITTDINNPHKPDNTGLGNLPNLGRNLAFGILFFTIPSAAINAVVQIVLCVREKIKLNKEKQNGTL